MLYFAFGQIVEEPEAIQLDPDNHVIVGCKIGDENAKQIIFLRESLQAINLPQPIQINKINSSNYSYIELFFTNMANTKIKLKPDWILFEYNEF